MPMHLHKCNAVAEALWGSCTAKAMRNPAGRQGEARLGGDLSLEEDIVF